jgi:hypothetical protein
MTIEKTDRKWFVLLLFGAIFLTTLPYFNALSNQGDKWVFSGFFMGVEDGNSYFAKMLSGMAGSWLFKTPYTTQAQNGIIAFLPYLLLGKLAYPPAQHIQFIMLFQLFRWAGIFIYLLGIYQFICLFITETKYRFLALLLAAFGGGLGWLLPFFGVTTIFGTVPLDYYSPEAFGFLSLYTLPHLAIARGLMFMGITVYIQNSRHPITINKFQYLVPGFILFLAGLFQPLNTAIGLILVFLYSIAHLIILKFDKVSIEAYVICLVFVTVPTLPVILYYGIAQFTDPFYKAWTAQNIISTPNPIHYLLAYAIPVIVILAHINSFGKILKKQEIIFLTLWIPVFLMLAYIPYNLQRRFPDGIFIALIVLMICVLEDVRKKYLWKLSIIIGILMIPSSVIIMISGILTGLNPAAPIFIPNQKVISYEQIGKTLEPGSRILANYQTGNELPVWSPVYMAMGHGPESIHLEVVKADADKYFGLSITDTERITILEKYYIDYVLKEKGKELFPVGGKKLPCFLELINEDNNFELFRVKSCE